MKLRTLHAADTIAHRLLDPYINATIRGHHLPGWGYLQLWQHRLCNAYERTFEENA